MGAGHRAGRDSRGIVLPASLGDASSVQSSYRIHNVERTEISLMIKRKQRIPMRDLTKLVGEEADTA